MTRIDDPLVKDAAENGLAALLVDRDVHEIASLEGGLLEVVRRGRRERLDAILEGPLFALLRESGAETGVVELMLRGGARLVAGPLADGRVALRVVKLPPQDIAIEQLVEEALLPPGIGDELKGAVLEGAGLAIIGPARSGRARVLLALARALAPQLSLAALHDGAPGTLAPLSPRAPLEHKVEAASELGADVLVGLDLSVRDAAAIARARPALPLLASVASPSNEALTAALDAAGIPLACVFGNVAVIGFGPDGRPRLVELHGPQRAGGGSDAGAPSQATSGAAPDVVAGAFAPEDEDEDARPFARAARSPAPSRALPESFGGAERPPGSWASDAPDVDPGWELANAGPPPEAGSFDAVLQSQRTRPSFTPRPPREHPQAQALKAGEGARPGRVADPFGGLTFEPPPGGPPSDDDIEPPPDADDAAPSDDEGQG